MNTWRRPPKDARLRHFIECYWYLEVSRVPHESGRVAPLLPPSALSHCILARRDHPFRYVAGGQSFQGRGCHLLFANRQTLRLEEVYPLARLGIAFKPGTLYAWLRLHGKATGAIGEADVSRIIRLERGVPSWLLGSVARPDEVVAYLDECLAPLIESARLDSAFHRARRAMAHLEARYHHGPRGAEPFATHAQLAAILGCSTRTLERTMLRVTGTTLSQYRAMLAFNGLFAHAYRRDKREIDWASIAQSFGFSDQPHLVRQLRRLIGCTPGEYLRRRHLLIDVYGDFGASSR